MLTHFGRANRLRAATLIGAVMVFAPGCSLIPTRDDISSATSYVKDTVTGKAKHDRQTQAFAEARIMERRQDFAAAEKLYRELLTEKPDSRDCYHRLAVIAAVQGKYPEASELYKKALACPSPTPDLWNDVGYCHYLQHQMPDAEGAFRQALMLAPQHRSALNNLAMTMGEQGNLEEAYRLFRQGNSEAEAEANFAYLCAQCGDLPRAQHHYSRALNGDPELKNAIDGLFQVTERLQKVNLAVARQQAAHETANGVQLVSHDGTPQFQPPKPLIQVYTSGSRPSPTQNASAIPTAAAPNAGAVQQAGGAQQAGGVQQAGGTQPPATPTPPATQPTMLFNTPTPTTPGNQPQPGRAPQPYSFQQQPQPQYLQPQSAPGSMPSNPGGASPASAPSLNAGGPFPPLVGGASVNR